MISRAKKSALFLLGFLFFANILAWIAVFEFSKPKALEVRFFDVGEGDAIFIETPERHQILIDGGANSKILEKLGKELPFFDKSLDLVILTHPQKDHFTGLLFVLRDYEVEQILWTGVENKTAGFEEWFKLLEEEKARIVLAKKGINVRAGSVSLKILFPFEDLAGQEIKNVNNTSIVSHLSFGKNSFLFTGDISSPIEKELIEKEIDLGSNVLKVAHHGSKYSSSEEFLEAVLPQLAVIQVGENPYGHPTKEVLQRLEKFDINVLRTDEKGDIKVISDGNNLKINFEK